MIAMKQMSTAAIKNERGTALVITLLLLLLVTGLGIASVMMGITDLADSGSFYKQKQAELTTDGGVELAEAMIFANSTSFAPGVATTGFLPVAILSNWSTFHRPIKYTDNDIDVQYTVKYKRQDNVNYYTGTSPHADDWVRYGKDYQYASALKSVGSQAVYTVTVTDNKTGAQSTADMVSSPGFIKAGAVFVKGNVYAMKEGLGTDERIELVSNTPSMPAITVCSGSIVYIQNVQSKTTNTYKECANGMAGYPTTRANGVAPNRSCTFNTQNMPAGMSVTDYCYAASQVVGTDGLDYVCIQNNTATSSNRPGSTATGGGSSAPTYWALVTDPTLKNGYVSPITGRAMYRSVTWQSGTNYIGYPDAASSAYGYLAADAYMNTEIAAEPNPAIQHDMYFILTQSGLDDNPNDSNVINKNYTIPNGGNITNMIGCSFSDYSAVADYVLPSTTYPALNNQTVPTSTGGTTTANNVIDMSNATFGSMSAGKVVYIKSNMNASGAYTGASKIILTTAPSTRMYGTGILVINGDAEIIGSINWTGVMIVRGNLTFWPWQGGDWCMQSGPDLSSKWDGLIAVGGDLNLFTLAGGSIFLGQYTALPTIDGMLSGLLPHKVLGWQRIYK